MQLLIKTPFSNHNKYLPHLVEHCICANENMEEFLSFNLDIQAATMTGYTELERNNIPFNKVLKQVTTPIAEKTFILESKIIKKELQSPSFGQKFYEKTLQKLVHPLIKTNTILEVGFQELFQYHQSVYCPEYMIFVDENNQIDFDFGLGKKVKENGLFLSNFTLPKFFEIKYQGEVSSGYIVNYQHMEDILVMDFFWDMLNSYQYAVISREKAQYYSDFFSYSLTDQHFILSYDGKLPKFSRQKLEKFFPIFQNYVLDQIHQGDYNSRKARIALLLQQTYDKNEHKKLIQTIDFSLIKMLLDGISSQQHKRYKTLKKHPTGKNEKHHGENSTVFYTSISA